MPDVESLLDENAALRQALVERDAIIAELSSEREANQAALAEAGVFKTKLTAALFEIPQMKLQRRCGGNATGSRRRNWTARSPSSSCGWRIMRKDLGEQIAAVRQPTPGIPPRSRPRQKPTGRRPLPAHLPREVVVHEPEITCHCGNCDAARLVKLGESTTEVLEKIPVRMKVIRHVRPKYACRLCDRVFQVAAPELPIEKGRPGSGLLANVAVSKYCDGIPLYHQSAIMEREGIEIDRATMAEWMGHVAWWAVPLAERTGQYVMAQPVIWTDDTPIRTLAPGQGQTRTARFWCYAVDPRPYAGSGHPAAFYRYSADRKGERPRSHLKGFSDYLHADAFAGYEALYRPHGNRPPRIIHVACMAHERRKLFEVFDPAHSPIAEEALRRIQKLYAIEAEIKGASADQRRRERQARSKPLLDALHGWMQRQRRRLSGEAPLGKALQYTLSRWDALTRYIEDGRLSIDNNLAERLLRGIAMAGSLCTPVIGA